MKFVLKKYVHEYSIKKKIFISYIVFLGYYSFFFLSIMFELSNHVFYVFFIEICFLDQDKILLKQNNIFYKKNMFFSNKKYMNKE
jgi:hypothetical protein